MKTKILAIAGLGVVIIGAAFLYMRGSEKSQVAGLSHKNLTYIIAGKPVTLVNGVSEVPAAQGSSAKVITRYFGNEIKKDLNGDGKEDVAFLITQTTGGSGTFFYVVAALTTENGYIGSEAVYLGDRIAPQTTESGPGKTITVNYADRNPGEPMTTQPSLGKSMRLILDNTTGQFGEVVIDFEGEVDTSRMKLTMKQWFFQSALYNDGTNVVLKNKDRYSVTFKGDGTFTATTDCNSVGGNYTATEASIEIKNVYSTKMYCEGSNEDKFIKLLQQFQIYHFTSKGELAFDLMYDTGVAIFK